MTIRHLSSLLLIAVTSCTPTSGIEDGENDSFASGTKADGAIEEGSPEALAILELVNSASTTTLVDTVGLTQAVAANIYGHRVGDDAEDGTEDDDPFDTLAELDAVPFVGPAVLSALREHAGGACSGTPATSSPVDLGGVFLTGVYRGTSNWGRLADTVNVPRTQNMHLLPGSVPHGTTLVIALEQNWADFPESPGNPAISKQEFEAYWGVTLGSKVIYRRANVTLFQDIPGDAELMLARLEETGVMSRVAKAAVAEKECRSFTGPNVAGVRRPALPGSATPGQANVQGSATAPFITEVCWHGNSPSLTVRGYAFVEIYVP